MVFSFMAVLKAIWDKYGTARAIWNNIEMLGAIWDNIEMLWGVLHGNMELLWTPPPWLRRYGRYDASIVLLSTTERIPELLMQYGLFYGYYGGEETILEQLEPQSEMVFEQHRRPDDVWLQTRHGTSAADSNVCRRPFQTDRPRQTRSHCSRPSADNLPTWLARQSDHGTKRRFWLRFKFSGAKEVGFRSPKSINSDANTQNIPNPFYSDMCQPHYNWDWLWAKFALDHARLHPFPSVEVMDSTDFALNQ
ncbi:hypothetical protein GGX14DRAFT_393347 [Mycena pura]|uniref:Uncharacterized protein n=1 Tax=Mycena pura TaxID=153505 RepID=A0AAD6YH20_9AGAR|nr:hypothetical protein GGX14DRAFT_393347 [Mycena pura]